MKKRIIFELCDSLEMRKEFMSTVACCEHMALYKENKEIIHL